VRAAAGSGVLPLYLSRDWSHPQPEVTRAVLVLHGRLRDADVYWRSAQKALQASGEDAHALMIVPQFPAETEGCAYVSHTDGLLVSELRNEKSRLTFTLSGFSSIAGGD